MAADTKYVGPGLQRRQDGTTAIPTGGSLDIESGGAFKFSGTTFRFARGETALDGTNPTAIATGLTTVVAFVCSLKGTGAPGVGTSIVTYDISGATVNLYGWKVTGAGDTTLIASTGTETVGWIAVGT